MSPSKPRWKRSKDASVRGTAHNRVFVHLEARKQVPTGPPNNRGSYGKNELAQDEGFSKNLDCTVDRGARYKVYATTNVSQTLTHHISDTRAGSRLLSSAQEQEALRGVRADRDAGRRTSRLQHGIDRGEALLQRHRAQDEPGQGLGGPSGAAPYESLPPDLD